MERDVIQEGAWEVPTGHYEKLICVVENSLMFVFLAQSYDMLIGMMKFRNASLKQEGRKKKLFSAKTNHLVPFVCLLSEIKPHLSTWLVLRIHHAVQCP